MPIFKHLIIFFRIVFLLNIKCCKRHGLKASGVRGGKRFSSSLQLICLNAEFNYKARVEVQTSIKRARDGITRRHEPVLYCKLNCHPIFTRQTEPPLCRPILHLTEQLF